jgi:bile acid:Na+ symporter, BASS family
MNLQSLVRTMFEFGIVLSVLKISIALGVLALGMQATFTDAMSVFRNPRDLGRAFLAMNVFMPLLALGLGLAFNLHPAVKIALVALAVSPVPPFFPKKAVKASGSENYSIGLLVATALLAIAVIPITMLIFERLTNVPLQMPARSVAVLVFASILAPVLVGIGVAAVSAKFAERLAKPIATLASVLLVLIVVPIFFASVRTVLSLIGNGTLLAFGAFALAGYFIGDLLGRPGLEKRRVLALATSSRHPAIAVAIAHANFPQQKLVVPAIILYLIVSGIVTGLASRRKPTRIEPARPEERVAA